MNTPTLIYCADGNKRFAEIAIRHGYLYGAQLPNTVYFAPYFADQDFKRPRYVRYIQALKKHRPVLASVLDWMREDQFAEIIMRAEEVSQYCDEVMIISKVPGGISRIPRVINGKPVRLGYSVPTSFGGTPVDTSEFEGWPVHLLGGSPHRQMGLAKKMNVVSADGNMAQLMANTHCAYFGNGAATYAKNRFWPKLNENKLEWIDQDVPYFAFELSCINIKAGWRGATCAVRMAVESDIPRIKQIANQYKNELGYVMYPSLREGIAKRELHIAEYGQHAVGFVRWHRCRDGWSTIYEIAVDKEHKGSHVGSALLCAVPAPIRLKCTVDNSANTFYEHEGFKFVETQTGRKRPLNVWHRAA